MKKLNKAQANQIANIWNTLHAGVTEETKTIALVVENSIKGYDVEVHNVGEKNRKTAFYHLESLVNICATFNCSIYIRYWDGEVYAVIY